MSDVTLILQSLGASKRYTHEELLPLVYGELRRIAAFRMSQESSGHTLQPTALVHEAWLRLVKNGSQTWENRAHFFGAASETMRRILIESARRKASIKHGRGLERVNIDDGMDVAQATPETKLLLIDELLSQLEVENPERAQVVMLKFFGGLSNRDAAQTMGIGERTVNRHWLCAKNWFCRKLKAEL
jgi:RNA polymerase sigma factor (TIGR02999 family)